MDARVGFHFMYAEIVRIAGDHIRENLKELMTTTDGVTPFGATETEDVVFDEMAERNRNLVERGIKPPKGWTDSMDLEGLFD